MFGNENFQIAEDFLFNENNSGAGCCRFFETEFIHKKD